MLLGIALVAAKSPAAGGFSLLFLDRHRSVVAGMEENPVMGALGHHEGRTRCQSGASTTAHHRAADGLVDKVGDRVDKAEDQVGRVDDRTRITPARRHAEPIRDDDENSQLFTLFISGTRRIYPLMLLYNRLAV
jgi:hypothetical protein